MSTASKFDIGDRVLTNGLERRVTGYSDTSFGERLYKLDHQSRIWRPEELEAVEQNAVWVLSLDETNIAARQFRELTGIVPGVRATEKLCKHLTELEDAWIAEHNIPRGKNHWYTGFLQSGKTVGVFAECIELAAISFAFWWNEPVTEVWPDFKNVEYDRLRALEKDAEKQELADQKAEAERLEDERIKEGMLF